MGKIRSACTVRAKASRDVYKRQAQYQAAADPQVAFFSFWTLKEAWAKYTGNGLGGFPNYTHFGLSPPAMSGLDTPSFLVQQRNDCMIAVCSAQAKACQFCEISSL